MKLNYNVDYKCKEASTDVTISELKLITECISNNNIKNYLEVGVWYGATLYSVVKLFKLNGVILDAYGYDCFEEAPPSNIKNSHTSGWPVKSDVQHILREFDNIKLITGNASNIDKIILDKKFDFVFHDVNHTKEAIVGDLISLKKILKSNAFVVVHNSSRDEPHRNFYGKSAITFLVENNHYRDIGTADTATLLQKI